MPYGLDPNSFLEDGPAAQLALIETRRSTARTWRVLDASRRLALVECALKPAAC